MMNKINAAMMAYKNGAISEDILDQLLAEATLENWYNKQSKAPLSEESP